MTYCTLRPDHQDLHVDRGHDWHVWSDKPAPPSRGCDVHPSAKRAGVQQHFTPQHLHRETAHGVVSLQLHLWRHGEGHGEGRHLHHPLHSGCLSGKRLMCRHGSFGSWKVDSLGCIFKTLLYSCRWSSSFSIWALNRTVRASDALDSCSGSCWWLHWIRFKRKSKEKCVSQSGTIILWHSQMSFPCHLHLNKFTPVKFQHRVYRISTELFLGRWRKNVWMLLLNSSTSQIHEMYGGVNECRL